MATQNSVYVAIAGDFVEPQDKKTVGLFWEVVKKLYIFGDV
ncbi:hypothetical protein [Flavobacterium sp. UBA6135]|nr:hypothetical protein [Flavobacterium sp. UBA6135]